MIELTMSFLRFSALMGSITLSVAAVVVLVAVIGIGTRAIAQVMNVLKGGGEEP